MDETSARMLERYEAWKLTMGEVDALMKELRGDGLGDLDELNKAIDLMRVAWREFEEVSEPRLHRGKRRA